MTFPACSRQREMSELLARGHWPHACPPDLRAHLAGCGACNELLHVTQAFLHSRAEAVGEVKLPAAGALWWRAQLRRRNAALERVGKPILGAYVFALSITLVVAAVIAVSQAKNGLHWLESVAESSTGSLRADSFHTAALFSSGGSLAVLIPVLATAALVGAVVVYFATERQ